jgi:hypothetical protein
MLSITSSEIDYGKYINIPSELYVIDKPMCIVSILSLHLINKSENVPIYDLEYYNDNWEKILDIIHDYLSKIVTKYQIKWLGLDKNKYSNLCNFYFSNKIS